MKYYDHFSIMGPFAFALASIRARSKVEKIGWINRQRDYFPLYDDAIRLGLHRHLHEILADAAERWQSYDYGEGYFYQGYRSIGLTGLRDTDARIDAMRLLPRIIGRSVLEIGCNTGFLSLNISKCAASVTGFDINPHLIGVARIVAEHVSANNVRFHVSRFEDWDEGLQYEVVLSFANHSTYDENTSQSISEYFRRCANLIQPGGILIFESHPPSHEGKNLGHVVREIERHFEISNPCVLEYGTFLDRGRTFIVGSKR